MMASTDGARPAKPPLTAGALWLLRGLFVVCLLFAVVGLIGSIGKATHMLESTRKGVDTTATIVSLRSVGGRTGHSTTGVGYRSPRHMVTYRFTADGKTVIGSRRISRSRFESLSTMQKINVRYLPRDPGIHEIEQDEHWQNFVSALLLTIIFGSAAGFLGRLLLRLPRRVGSPAR